jgi:hypothetical protein
MNLETLKTLTDWSRRTALVLDREIVRWKLQDTRDLQQSLKERVDQKTESLLVAQLQFLVRGRFQDMGAGRGSKRNFESRDGNRELLGGSKRKAKRWYSRAFWGRINDLQGVLGYRLMESAINSVKEPLEWRSTGNVGRPML